MEHVDIPDGERHEPKGAGGAATNQVLKSVGGGATQFSFITIDSMPGVAARGFIRVLESASTALTQNPVAVDTPLQVEFGPLQATDSCTLAADGTLTFNEAGTYGLNLFVRYGRTAGAGNAIVLTRVLKNDVQVLNTNSISMPDAVATHPFSAFLIFDAIPGDTFKLQIARDSAGVNNGGLVRTLITTLPWNLSSSATIAVYKHRGLE